MTRTFTNRILCLPIELYNREIDTRIYLADEAIKRGYSVIMGHWKDQAFTNVKNSIFFMSPGHGDIAYETVAKFRDNGNKIFFQDEEGLIRKSDEYYTNVRVGRTARELADGHFACNSEHGSLLHQVGCNNITIAGSPKFDVIRKSKNLSAKSGNLVKINTRFAHANPLNTPSDSAFEENLIILKAINRDDLDEYRNFRNLDKRMLQEFVKLIELIGNDQSIAVSVRVHPAEDKNIYYDLARRFSNVQVETGIPLTESFSTASCLVHDACTTSLEAKAYGLKVLSLRPNEVGDYYNPFANQFSDVNFSDAKTLYEYLRRNGETDCHGESLEDAYQSVAPNISGYMFSDVMFQKFEEHASLNSHIPLPSRAKVTKRTGLTYLSAQKSKAVQSFFRVMSRWSKIELLSGHPKSRKFPLIINRRDLLYKLTASMLISNCKNQKPILKRLSPRAFLITGSKK